MEAIKKIRIPKSEILNNIKIIISNVRNRDGDFERGLTRF